jgi:hypothetical protein
MPDIIFSRRKGVVRKTRRGKRGRSLGMLIAIAGLVVLIALAGFYGENVFQFAMRSFAESPDVELTLAEEEFVDKLLEEWSRDFHLTTIDQVAHNENLEYTQEFRYRIATYLARTPTLHRQLIQWKAPSVSLTNDEKRIAAYILTRTKADPKFPTTEEMQKFFNLDERTLNDALVILYQFSFLDREKKLKYFPGPYFLREDHEEHVSEWFLHYVEIERESGERFNVQCIVDALKLVYEDFMGENIVITTYCPETLMKIKIVANRGEITEIDPPSSVVFLGGTCPMNLTFTKEAPIKRWVSQHPDIPEGKTYGVEELLENIKEER